jgi:uncharacterized membrane protein
MKDESTGQYCHDASVMVNAPAATCFELWSNFESFPSIMTYVQKVTKTDAQTWHWEAKVAGRHEEWDAAMTEFRPNETIAWRSVRGLENGGMVRFSTTDTGCLISVHLCYNPPFGVIGDLVAERSANDEFHAQLQQDLLNFKHAVESGNVDRYRRAA